MKKAKHLAEEYGEKAVNKVKSVRDEGKIFETDLNSGSHQMQSTDKCRHQTVNV